MLSPLSSLSYFPLLSLSPDDTHFHLFLPSKFIDANSQSTRGIKSLDFAGTKETVYERADWPTEKLTE
jgi:hypothetical protein